MNTYEMIDAAAALIETGGWSQGCNARDADGEMTMLDPGPDGSQPVAFCAHGALCMIAQKVTPKVGDSAYFAPNNIEGRAFDALNRASPAGAIVAFNDTPGRTKEEVIALMRDTASKLRTAEVVADDKLHAALFN